MLKFTVLSLKIICSEPNVLAAIITSLLWLGMLENSLKFAPQKRQKLQLHVGHKVWQKHSTVPPTKFLQGSILMVVRFTYVYTKFSRHMFHI